MSKASTGHKAESFLPTTTARIPKGVQFRNLYEQPDKVSGTGNYREISQIPADNHYGMQ